MHAEFWGVTADAFPAKAGPTKFAFVQSYLDACDAFSGTGFSREGACMSTHNSAV